MGYVMLGAGLVKPTGLWESIIYWIESGVLNYGLTIILFTLLIKLALSPLDYFIKYSSKKTTLIQKKLSPQVAKLQKKYGNDQTAFNAQLNALYKREGLNMITSCLVMFVNLILTLVIFISVFNSMRYIASYKMINQYEDLRNTYDNCLSVEEANSAVVARYDEIKDNFLWINNIWRPDSWSTIIPTYKELNDAVKNSGATYKNYIKDNISEEQYEQVMTPIREANTGWNGYLILSVLVGAMYFLSQKLTEKQNDIKGVKDPQIPANQSMALMKYMLPAIGVIFALTSNSAFGLYLLTSSAAGSLTSLLINIIVSKATRKLEEETKQILLKQELKIKK